MPGFDPSWTPLVGALLYVWNQLFGAHLKRIFAAWTERLTLPYQERTKTKKLRARAQGDAELAAERELAEPPPKSKRPVLQDTGRAELATYPGEAVIEAEFEIKEDASLLSPAASLIERAKAAGEHRAATRQENLEAVLKKMLTQPAPKDPGDARPSKTFLSRFADDAGDTEDEEIREIFARLLAGEIGRPGRFSLRTLATVRNLSAVEAQIFDRLCDYALNGSVIVIEQMASLEGCGLSFGHIVSLVDAGLLVQGNITWGQPMVQEDKDKDERWGDVDYNGKVLRFRGATGSAYHFKAAAMTTAGRELASLKPHRFVQSFVDKLRGIVAAEGIQIEVRDTEDVNAILGDKPETD